MTAPVIVVLVMLSLALVALVTPFAGKLVKRQQQLDNASQDGSPGK